MSQNWIVAALVVLAAVYSLWYLMPAALRRRLGALHSTLGRSPGCASGCDSCGKCPGSAAGSAAPTSGQEEQPITIHRRD